MIQFRTLDIDGLWNKFDSRSIEPSRLVPRHGLKHIKSRFDSDHIEVIIGPRQSGKTTALMMLMHELSQKGIKSEQIFYINLDTIPHFQQFTNPLLLVEQINLIRQNNERIYLFLDEVQRLETPGRFLKGVYDLNPNIKVFATGSSSLELNSKIKEYLTGRKRETYIFPISVKEYIDFQGKIPNRLNNTPLTVNTVEQWQRYQQIYGKYFEGVVDETAIYGGYPAVLKAKKQQERLEELNEIYQSYVKKDIIEFLQLGKAEVFTNLLKVLAAQAGNLVNKSEICSLLGCNSATITKYMNILKETYVADFLPPFVSSRRNEIKSAHKCYFIDNGIRNFAIRQFGDYQLRPDKGAVLENLIFSEMVKGGARLNESLFFWRTKSGAEMDFMIRLGERLIPVEVKTGTAKPGLLSKSFHSFIESFSPSHAIFLNRDLFHIEKIKNTLVYYIPAHWFLLYGTDFIFGS